MKLDPKTAERMKRAAIERQAAKAAEAAKRPSKRDPGYDEATRRKLKKAGLNARTEQPESVLEALRKIPDAQKDRITSMDYRDAPSRDHKSERAAMVQQVHPAVAMLTLRAQAGWLEYAELWESAQPNQTMSYGERIGGSCEEKDRDPTWLVRAGELRVFNKRLDPSVSRKADEIMRMRESIAFNAIALSIMEKVGIRLAKAFKDWE